MRHRKRLPFERQIWVRIIEHLIAQEWEKAEELLKIQLEMEPNNQHYNDFIGRLYLQTSQYDKLLNQAEKQYNKDSRFSNYFSLLRALLLNGRGDQVIDQLENYYEPTEQRRSIIWEILMEAYMLEGRLDEAKAICEKIILVDPESEPFISINLDAIDFMKNNTIDQAYLSKFEGIFRNEKSKILREHVLLNGLIFGKTVNQTGYYSYPAGHSTLKKGSVRYGVGGRQMDQLLNAKGEAYAIKKTDTWPSIRKLVYYLWKQDSIIWQAEDLWRRAFELLNWCKQKFIDYA